MSEVPGWGSWNLLGVVLGVMVPGECGTWLGVMALAVCRTWCDETGVCGTWLGVKVLAMGVVPGVMQ